MKQTARNSTNDLHRRFFATIQDHYVYGLRCVHLCTPLSLFNPRPTCSQFSTLLFRFTDFSTPSASKLSRRVFAFPLLFLFSLRREERRERREIHCSRFWKEKKRNRYRYRGIARVWLDIQHVSSRWDRSLMHSREEWDGNPFTTRNRYANSWRRKKKKKKKFLLSSPFFVG